MNGIELNARLPDIVLADCVTVGLCCSSGRRTRRVLQKHNGAEIHSGEPQQVPGVQHLGGGLQRERSGLCVGRDHCAHLLRRSQQTSGQCHARGGQFHGQS